MLLLKDTLTQRALEGASVAGMDTMLTQRHQLPGAGKPAQSMKTSVELTALRLLKQCPLGTWHPIKEQRWLPITSS